MFFRVRLALPHYRNRWGCEFRIGDNTNRRLCIAGEGNIRVGRGIFILGNAAEMLFDRCFYSGGVYVSYNYHCLTLRIIPGGVEIVDGRLFECFEIFLLADEGASCIFGVAEPIGQACLHCAPVCVAAAAAFLYDYRTLKVEFLFFIEYIVGVFA